MGHFLHNHRLQTVVTLLLIFIAVLSACAPNPRGQLISPNMVPEGAGEEFVLPTPTPIPNIAELSEEQIAAGLPEDVLAGFPGDAANGQQLTVANACIGCHQPDPNFQGAGPTWYNLANTAIVRKSGMGPAAYLHESITDPNAHIVQGFPPGVMPQTYAETLSAEQLADIITYLLTLRGDAE